MLPVGTGLDLAQVQATLKDAGAEQVVKYAMDRFGDRVALACSFGAEDVVLVDIMARLSAKPHIFTLDTGRLPQETYDVWEQLRKKYAVTIEVFAPDATALEDFSAAEGPNAFYNSIALRKECCRVRKILPLRRALGQLDAWICGLRREQSVTRAAVEKVELDAGNGNMVKINPLADWTEKQVWDYIKKNNVPYNALHDRNYPSIGCGPCTRAVKPGEDVRAGRWWWESPETKECGLHAHVKEPTASKAPAGTAPEKKQHSSASGEGASVLAKLLRGIRWFLEPTFI